ncbi:MAG: hypothetical protein NDI94_06730, partial [Candidatus Woesearchaeota archaeon]|nr:hypothetical protein [Candidatus Woesearchaeota archaeon]
MDKSGGRLNKKLIFILFALILVYSVLAEDTDGDGMDDAWEILYFKSLTQNQLGDFDKDTVNNLVEFSLKSNPSVNDTDSDKFLDGIEYFYATNLTDAKSYPKESANKITLISPRFGTASLNTFTLLVGTANKSTCKTSISSTDKYDSIVAQSQLFTTSNNLNHTKQMSISSQIETRLYIYCKTTVGGYTNDAFPKEVVLSVDATKPVISSAIAEPNPVFEKLEVDLISQTDDKTICRYFTTDVNPMGYTAAFSNVSLSEFSTKTTKRLDATTNPAIEDLKTYNLVAVCMNKAEQVDIEPITFYVNLSVSNRILELSPSGITNKAAPMIRVVTNKGSTCRYGEGYVNEFSQINSKDHYYQETNLSSKSYTIPILCQFNDAQVIESSIVFSIDTVPPSAPLVTAKDKTCDK